MDLDFDNIPDATVEEVVEEEVFNAPPPPVPYEEPVFEMPDPDPIEEDALTYVKRQNSFFSYLIIKDYFYASY